MRYSSSLFLTKFHVCFFIISGLFNGEIMISYPMAENYIEPQCLQGHSAPVLQVSFSPNGAFLASNAYSVMGEVIIWSTEVKTNNNAYTKWQIKAHSFISCLNSSDSQLLYRHLVVSQLSDMGGKLQSRRKIVDKFMGSD
jgi:WD40 repeat protein